MPEYIILISAVVCAGSGVALYFNRGNAAALGVLVLGFIALLYGIGQYAEREKVIAETGGGVKKAETPTVVQRLPAAQQSAAVQQPAAAQQPVQPEVTKLDGLGTSAPSKSGGLPSTVTISNFSTQKIASRYVEVWGTVTNRNDFAIKNVVVKCGDISYASGDVSATVDKIVPAKSNLQVTGLRMGPINPTLPPTICVIAKFERAD